jgi:F-type H+-transporting ATPase subunit delta
LAGHDFVGGNAIIRRYVESLHEISISRKIEQSVSDQIENIKKYVESIANFKVFLKRASLVAEYGDAFIGKLKSDLNLTNEVFSFLKLLQKNKRLSSLADVCSSYSFFLDVASGRKIVHVTYAKEISKYEKKELMQDLESALDGEIKCVWEENSSLIDGIKIQYRSKILDYSMKSKLARLHSAIRKSDYEN